MLTVGTQKVIHVESGRGEELRQHLASHGINARVIPTAPEASFERLEIAGGVGAEVLQRSLPGVFFGRSGISNTVSIIPVLSLKLKQITLSHSTPLCQIPTLPALPSHVERGKASQ
jgi:hypothetical protein